MPKIIPRLDIMIAYSCNISCRGCISLSDLPRNGVARLNDITEWIDHWRAMLQPKVVTLFGGEPCLHPELLEICRRVRTAWPTTTIRLITNGYLLKNFDSAAWFDFEPFEMQVSMHRADHRSTIDQAIKNILMTRKGWQVKISEDPQDHCQISWQLGDFKIYKSVFKDFVVPFRSQDDEILPWMSDPAESHAICGSPNTPILYKGQLYKCPAVANVMDITGNNWFDYEPCADAAHLDEFVAGIGVPELVCGQCPSRSQAVVIDHLNTINVVVKQKSFS
jgi:organic radical activating enzyme